jgi:hypothetical protein
MEDSLQRRTGALAPARVRRDHFEIVNLVPEGIGVAFPSQDGMLKR